MNFCGTLLECVHRGCHAQDADLSVEGAGHLTITTFGGIMDLRFAVASIGIQVTTEELSRLCSGRSIGLRVSMPRGHAFNVKLTQTNLTNWLFDSDPTGLWLSVPRAELALLGEDATARQSIAHQFNTQEETLTITLQVNSTA